MSRKIALDDLQKLDIMIGICSALVYLHSSKRDASSREKSSEFSESHSHRDLKPENIMYQDGVAKLIDFGVAKMSRQSTHGTSVQGTYNWMSPEQALTDARKTFTQCDMFSFGLISKWLLSGVRDEVPFKDVPTDHIIMEHRRIYMSGGYITHPYVADLSLVRPEFRSIIQCCTATHASKRWTAPKAMLELRQLKSRLAEAAPSVFGVGAGFVTKNDLHQRHMSPPDLESSFIFDSPARSFDAAPAVPHNQSPAQHSSLDDLMRLQNSYLQLQQQQQQHSNTLQLPVHQLHISQPAGYPSPSAPPPPVHFSLEHVTSDTYAATATYFSDIEFALYTALQLCQENFEAEVMEKDSVSIQMKQACDVFRRILLLQPQPSAKAHLLTVFNMTKHGADPSLSARAMAQLDRQPTWPRHAHFFCFDKYLFRLTRHGSKKWIKRLFVLRGRRLYHTNGKNGFPDSLVGTMAFIRSKPVPDGHYCIDLRGGA
jgi:serine/threonine protein kinase